ncbi:hypothetical protein EIKCOROL_01612 [Eikenella corrodens ATCC 23834]|uniref:Uncharacterized protein n=1 Tax=Eikenella corrodens ATCC 23834 TaxID=546274 RepID=C0DW62_EIKCO|nr:hypothetical protein EIKCOROL_01612 [Eikenella corrodens ATCC 23834]
MPAAPKAFIPFLQRHLAWCAREASANSCFRLPETGKTTERYGLSEKIH